MPKLKIIVDQDARGPGTSDIQAILVFLQSEKLEVLGITTVSGDQWVREETQHVLRLLEIAGRTDVPVYQGAEFPLLNSKEETERWEAICGKLPYKGCWTVRFPPGRSTVFEHVYHAPEVIPAMPEGEPGVKPARGHAAQFIGGRGAAGSGRRDRRCLARRRAGPRSAPPWRSSVARISRFCPEQPFRS